MLEIAEENYTMREITMQQQQQQQQGRMFSSQTKDSPTTYFQNTRREVVSSRPEPSSSKTRITNQGVHSSRLGLLHLLKNDLFPLVT